mgnify:CR=1 FL=1
MLMMMTRGFMGGEHSALATAPCGRIAAPVRYDLLIKNSMLVDGTGAPAQAPGREALRAQR